MPLIPPWPYTDFHSLNLDWWIKKLVETANNLAGIDARVDQKIADSEAKLQATIDEWKKTLDDIQIKLNESLENIDEAMKNQAKQFQDFIDAQNKKLEEFQAIIEGFEGQLDNNYWLMKSYVDMQIAILRELINKPIEGPVYNVFRQKTTSITVALEDYYNYLRDHAFTAAFFDTSGLTAGQFDSLGFTALSWDLNGHNHISDFKKLWPWFMYSPWTGIRTPVSQVVEQLWQYHGVGLTCGVWDNMTWTAGEFDAKQYTAYILDWTNVPLELDSTTVEY